MKKTFVSMLLLLVGLSVSQASYGQAPLPPLPSNFRGIVNTTPFFIHVYMVQGANKDRMKYDIAPFEAVRMSSLAAHSADVEFEIPYIIPDAIEALLGDKFPVKNRPNDFSIMKAGHWKSNSSAGNTNTGPGGTWYVGGPYCIGQTCSVDPNRPNDAAESPSSLYRYESGKRAYEAELQRLGLVGDKKPTNQRELAKISTPIVQKNEHWRLAEVETAAKSAPNGLLRGNQQDHTKNIYYLYSPGEITRRDSKGVNQTFAIK